MGVNASLRKRAAARNGAALAVDRNGRVVFCNEAAGRILTRPADQVRGMPLVSLLEVKDAFGNRTCTELCGLWEMAERGEPIRRFALDLCPAGDTGLRRFIVDAEVVEEVAEEPGSRRQLLLFLLPDRRRSRAGAAGEGARDDRDTRAVELTRRQVQILGLLAEGRSSVEIAGLLSISVNTVRKHIQASLRKLGAHSQVQAVAAAIRQGLL